MRLAERIAVLKEILSDCAEAEKAEERERELKEVGNIAEKQMKKMIEEAEAKRII